MVSCGSAFPALFTASTHRSKKKPEFSPSQSFLRIMSRIQSLRKRQQSGSGDDTTWLDLTTATRNNTAESDGNSSTMVTEDTHGHDADPESGDESVMTQANDSKGSSMLTPHGPEPMPAYRTYTGTSPQNTIAGHPENWPHQHFELGKQEAG